MWKTNHIEIFFLMIYKLSQNLNVFAKHIKFKLKDNFLINLFTFEQSERNGL